MKRTFATYFSLIVLGSLVTTAPAHAWGLVPEFEACVRENAPKVERAIASMEEGLQFLMKRVCGKEYVAQFSKDADEDDASDKPRGSSADVPPVAIARLFLSVLGGSKASAETISFVSKLLLDLRTARLEREGRH